MKVKHSESVFCWACPVTYSITCIHTPKHTISDIHLLLLLLLLLFILLALLPPSPSPSSRCSPPSPSPASQSFSLFTLFSSFCSSFFSLFSLFSSFSFCFFPFAFSLFVFVCACCCYLFCVSYIIQIFITFKQLIISKIWRKVFVHWHSNQMYSIKIRRRKHEPVSWIERYSFGELHSVL